jgi:hypothetical protein
MPFDDSSRPVNSGVRLLALRERTNEDLPLSSGARLFVSSVEGFLFGLRRRAS